MNLIISSKYFASELKKLRLGDNISNMEFAFINDNILTLKSNCMSVDLNIENVGRINSITPISHVKWDFLLQNLEQMPDQPIYLEFSSHHLDMRFQF